MAVWISYWELRCEKCSDGQKKIYGCEENSCIPDYWRIREWVWQRCPVKLITRQTRVFYEAYEYLQKGILPYQVGYKGNTNRYVEAMNILETEIKKIEMKKLKEAKR